MEYQGAMTDARPVQAIGLGIGNRLSTASDIGQERAKIARESGVLSEVERLGRAVSEHEQTLTVLLSKIEPIVRSGPPEGTGNGTATPEAPLCHVGATIRDERRRLEAMSAILREIAKRIDL